MAGLSHCHMPHANTVLPPYIALPTKDHLLIKPYFRCTEVLGNCPLQKSPHL